MDWRQGKRTTRQEAREPLGRRDDGCCCGVDPRRGSPALSLSPSLSRCSPASLAPAAAAAAPAAVVVVEREREWRQSERERGTAAVPSCRLFPPHTRSLSRGRQAAAAGASGGAAAQAFQARETTGTRGRSSRRGRQEAVSVRRKARWPVVAGAGSRQPRVDCEQSCLDCCFCPVLLLPLSLPLPTTSSLPLVVAAAAAGVPPAPRSLRHCSLRHSTVRAAEAEKRVREEGRRREEERREGEEDIWSASAGDRHSCASLRHPSIAGTLGALSRFPALRLASRDQPCAPRSLVRLSSRCARVLKTRAPLLSSLAAKGGQGFR